ncbi:MAG: hypothetical protein HOP12_12805, partial [Candidatus Eisenbacteria bacterium]|nr:hypothetical protein [Candidatus Eisenbacteria bacterium]
LVEVSLKLLPAPTTRVALGFSLDGAVLADARRWAALPRLEPAGSVVLGPAHATTLRSAAAVGEPAGGRSFLLAIGLESDAPWVAAQEQRLRDAFGAPDVKLEAGSALAWSDRVGDLANGARDQREFVSPHRAPTALAPWLDAPLAETLVFHTAHGRLVLDGTLLPDAEEDGAQLAALDAAGFRLAAGGPGSSRARVQGVALASLRGRIRTALDPLGTFGYGDAWVGLSAPGSRSPLESVAGAEADRRA